MSTFHVCNFSSKPFCNLQLVLTLSTTTSWLPCGLSPLCLFCLEFYGTKSFHLCFIESNPGIFFSFSFFILEITLFSRLAFLIYLFICWSSKASLDHLFLYSLFLLATVTKLLLLLLITENTNYIVKRCILCM